MRFCFLIISLSLFQTVFSQTPAYSSRYEFGGDSVYIFKAKLTDNSALPPGCGVMAFATAKKFEIIETNYYKLINNIVFIIFECPESYGPMFFVSGKTYSVKARIKKSTSTSWTIIPPNYAEENLPVFYVQNIRMLKK